MKRKSTKQLAIMLGIVFISILALQLTSHIGAYSNTTPGVIIKPEDAKDFRNIQIEGQWEVTIIQRKNFGLELDYSAKLKKFLSVTLEPLSTEDGQNNNILKFHSQKKFGIGKWQEPSATVYMPSLKNIRLLGASNAKFSGFTESEMEVNLLGASKLEGNNISAENLELDIAGNSKINFYNLMANNAQISLLGASKLKVNGTIEDLTLSALGASKGDFNNVTNADVDLLGASKVYLQMAGGILSGKLTGASTLEYRGDVSERNISTVLGASKVEYLD